MSQSGAAQLEYSAQPRRRDAPGRTVVLVHPGTRQGWRAQPWCDMPLELLYVGSPLARKGYQVEILDLRLERRWRERLSLLLARKPVCVGVTSTTGPQLRQALAVSRMVKEQGETPVVWGGVHASLLPEQVLAEPCVDYVVQGEGERTFEELVEAIANRKGPGAIPGLWRKDGGAPACGAPRRFIDLDAEPPPHYDLAQVERYRRRVFGIERLIFSTSRGCSFPCAFCYSTVMHKRRWRALSAPNAVEQMQEFSKKYGIKGLFLTDANFFLDLDRARAILEECARRELGLVFTRLHIRLDGLRRLTAEDWRLMERAGVKSLAMGVESGSPRIRALLHKEIDEAELLELNRRFARSPIMPIYFFMLGLPTETLPELESTVGLITRLISENPKAFHSANVYTPFPGTELFQLAVQCGWRPPDTTDGWFDFSYRWGGGGAWMSPDVREKVAMLDFCLFFLGERGYLQPFKATNRLAVAAARLYSPVARWRVRHMCSRLPLEIVAARKLGLYGNG